MVNTSPALTFEQIYARQIPRRLERLTKLIELNAPGVIIGQSFAFLLEALTAKYGTRIWEQIVAQIINRQWQAAGWCTFHEKGVGTAQRRVEEGGGRRMCVECIVETDAELAAESAEENDGA